MIVISSSLAAAGSSTSLAYLRAPVVVKASSNGYGGYENSSHRYFIRVFAKAKGSNRVWYAAVGHSGVAPFEVSEGPVLFKQTAGH